MEETQAKPEQKPQPLEISVRSLVVSVVVASVLVGLFGGLATWLVAGWSGLWAEIAAGAIVTGVMIVNGWITASAGRNGPRSSWMAFLASTYLRVMVCAGLMCLVWWLFDLEIMPLGVWFVIFYLLDLGVESVWIIRALRRHEKLYGMSAKGQKEDKAC